MVQYERRMSMLISTLLSFGSLLFGLIVWIVPFLAMKHPRQDVVKIAVSLLLVLVLV